MHYYSLIEELYQAYYNIAGERWEEERDNETQADHEIKRLIAALARQLIQVYQERLEERAREQQEDEENDSHCDTERYDEDANN
jgi:hypothetical protein